MDKRDIPAWLEQVQLAGAADRPVRTYSGGMRRRPCPRTWSQGRRLNDENLAAWPGREARAARSGPGVSRSGCGPAFAAGSARTADRRQAKPQEHRPGEVTCKR